MQNLSINELIQMLNELQNRMKGKWPPAIPDNGHFSLLWMYEELGEVVAITKKRGNDAIMEDEAVRSAFVEELVDVLMYYVDLMTCFNVTSDEISQAFIAKHQKNMRRDFIAEHAKYLSSEKE